MATFKLKAYPKDYQKAAVEFAVSHNASIIAIETGGGKTFCCIAQALALLNMGKVDKVVQICTKKSKFSFASDYGKLTDIDIDKQVKVIYDEADLLDFQTSKECLIAVVQYDNFKKISAELWLNFVQSCKVLVQLDEFHKAKTPMTELCHDTYGNLSEKLVKSPTQLNTILYTIRPHIEYFTGYTATPIQSNIADAFWLGSLTVPYIFNNSLLYFYNTFIDYKAYRIPVKKGSKYKRTVIDIISFKNQELLKEKLDSFIFNYFPPKNINFIKVYYNPNSCLVNYTKAVSGVLEIYKERKVDENGDKEAKTFSARMLDAQYVLNNSDEKQQAFLETLQKTIGNGVLSYGYYYNTIDVIKDNLEKCKIPYQEISGKTSDKALEKAMDWFNSSPEGKVAVLSSAGSQSLNLQSTNNFIFYDLPYTPGAFIQAIGRIIRLGSKYDEFNVYILISQDTLDEYKYLYLSSNQETLSYLQGNNNLFTSPVKSPNAELLRMLRKSKLWDKGIR